MMRGITTLAILSVTGVQTASAQVGVTPTSPDLGNRLQFLAGDTYSYDDNLFRLPASGEINGSGVLSRQDHVNTVNLGVDGHYFGWRQEFDLSIRAAQNRFARNDALNNVSGLGRLSWDWLINSRLSGTAGYDFNRAQASFANTFFFSKDLVETSDYFASGGLRLTQHWTITTGIKATDVTHSAAERAGDEFRSKAGNLGLQYSTLEQNTFALNYSYTDARFPTPGFLNEVQFDRNYKDSLEQLVVRYRPGGATQIDAKVGYIERRYPNSNFGSFTGNTWRATVSWAPTAITRFSFAGWRELTAYLDSESDYFVSRGGSATLTWSPTLKIGVSASASFNSQRYINDSPSVVQFTTRHDNLRTYQVNVTYSPRALVVLGISYRYDVRDSNEPQLIYLDRLALATITLRL